jgi:hypothetical protein
MISYMYFLKWSNSQRQSRKVVSGGWQVNTMRHISQKAKNFSYKINKTWCNLVTIVILYLKITKRDLKASQHTYTTIPGDGCVRQLDCGNHVTVKTIPWTPVMLWCKTQYAFSLCSWYLAHSSKNPCNFLSYELSCMRFKLRASCLLRRHSTA